MEELHDTITQEYIEVIDHLERMHRVARVKDIAQRRGVTRSSVSIALNGLAGKNLIRHEQYGHVTLTAQGRRVARNLEQRHSAIRAFLTDILAVDPELADRDACQIEHIMSRETLSALTDFLEFVRTCPRQGRDFLKHFGLCTRGKTSTDDCSICLASQLE